MAAVHSSCCLCIYLETQIQEKEESAAKDITQHLPCICKKGSETLYHLYVIEKGRFEMKSIFIRSRSLTLKGLELVVLSMFKYLKHVPIWKTERPEMISRSNKLNIYRMYPIDLSQREALYAWKFYNDDSTRSYVNKNPCARLKVIFV